jgi:hypothetical protein
VRRYNSAALPGETENIFRRWYPDFRPQGQVKKAAHPEPRAIPKEHLEGDSAANETSCPNRIAHRQIAAAAQNQATFSSSRFPVGYGWIQMILRKDNRAAVRI